MWVLRVLFFYILLFCLLVYICCNSAVCDGASISLREPPQGINKVVSIHVSIYPSVHLYLSVAYCLVFHGLIWSIPLSIPLMSNYTRVGVWRDGDFISIAFTDLNCVRRLESCILTNNSVLTRVSFKSKMDSSERGPCTFLNTDLQYKSWDTEWSFDCKE